MKKVSAYLLHMTVGRRSTELRRAELTDAALAIIATRGIAALSTRALAEEVGLTTGAIFRHFASLEALLEAVVDRVEAVIELTYPTADLPPLARLERFVEARSAAVGKQLGILRLVLSEQFLLALPEHSSARLAACVTRSKGFVRGCVRDAQAEGAIRDDLDAGALAVIVMGTVQMLALSAADAQHRANAKSAARAVRAALFALLAPSPRTKGRPA
jgi:AcrR family transcriptional regulator